MASLGLNPLPQYNPANSPLNQGIGVYQNLQQFPLLQAQRQALIQSQQLQNQYYPQVTQADIALKQAQANSPEMNPVGAGQAIYKAFLNASSPQEKAFWASQLNKQSVSPMNMMGMPAGPANGAFSTNPDSYQGAQTGTGSMQYGAPQGSPQGFQAGQSYSAPASQMPPINNPILNMLSGYRTRAMQSASQDPNNPNNAVVTTSPTTETQDVNQVRDLSAVEASKLSPQIAAGIKPYNTPIGGNFDLLKDSVLARFGNKAAQQRLQDYANATAIMPDYGGLQAKMAGYSKPGVELANKYAKAVFPRVADEMSWAIPGDISTNAVTQSNKMLTDAQNAAQQEAAKNFPVSVPRSQLGWAGGVAGSNPPQQGAPPQQSQQLPPIPKFDNADEFRGWFKSLTPQQRLAYAPQLGGK